jgi:ribonuclease J
MRVATKSHRYLDIKRGDTVIFSSSVIPGNERSIQTLKDLLFRCGARVIHYKMMDIHAGGHAKIEEQKLLIRLLKPQFFIPIEAPHYLLQLHAKTAQSVGVPAENIAVPDNGQVVEIYETKKGTKKELVMNLTEERFDSSYVMVDGLGVGDVSSIVLRDRMHMSEDGMFVIIVTVDTKNRAIIGSPDLISRGFVYMKENRGLLNKVRHRTKKLFTSLQQDTSADVLEIKKRLRDEVGQLLYHETRRRPLILPVIIEV